MNDLERLEAAALALVGVRFRPQGRDVVRGVDCIGVLVCVARATGVSDYDFLRYRLGGDATDIQAHLRGAGLVSVPLSEAVRGDALLFSFGGAHWHMGVRTTHGFVHAHAGVRRVVEQRLDEAWQQRLVGAFRFPRQA